MFLSRSQGRSLISRRNPRKGERIKLLFTCRDLSTFIDSANRSLARKRTVCRSLRRADRLIRKRNSARASIDRSIDRTKEGPYRSIARPLTRSPRDSFARNGIAKAFQRRFQLVGTGVRSSRRAVRKRRERSAISNAIEPSNHRWHIARKPMTQERIIFIAAYFFAPHEAEAE